MPVTDVGIDDQSYMELPPDPAVAGWYRYAADADSEVGSMVIAAHVDVRAYGIGPLAKLRDLNEGDTVDVVAEDGSVRTYVTESLTYYEKDAVPIDELFSREGEAALVIMTCGGPFDSATRTYRDNVVMVARPA